MKLRYSVGIATKMIFMVTFIVVTAIGTVMYITTGLFRQELETRVQEENKDLAEALSERSVMLFKDVREKMTLMAEFATRASKDADSIHAIQDILKRSDDLVSFSAYRFDENGKVVHQLTEINSVSAAEFNLRADDFKEKPLQANLNLHKNRLLDDVAVMNSSWAFNTPMVSVSFLSQREKVQKQEAPYWSNAWLAGRWLFRADIRADSIARLFTKKQQTLAFIVDGGGRLIAHSDPQRVPDVIKAIPMGGHELVREMMSDKTLGNRQKLFQAESGDAYLGAYRKIGISGIGVVVQVPQIVALATVYKAQYRAGLFMITVVCLAFLLNFALSKSLTRPLQLLFQATQSILEGKYDVKMRVRSSDEIGALSKAFMNMVDGLKEKEKLKGAFNKFHSKEIAKKLLSGEIKLGGERRQATVFFSDIRGFTAISEKMSPDQVVLLLNEYMSEMVKIIYNWHGVVDKYMGDAIMALWGVPETTPTDAYNAVRAALEMRDFLIDWNQKRRAKGQVEIRIGIGLASGDLLAGNIGSEHRLEYTVIGDTVNQASRIESACKPLATDLLISHSTFILLSQTGIVIGPEIHIRAKGKSDDVIIHQVIGYRDDAGTLKTTLTQEQIQNIQTTTVAAEYDEQKTQVIGLAQDVPESKWYVVPDVTSRVTEGPFSLKELGLKVAQKQVNFNTAHVFEEGSDKLMPIAEMMGLSRRSDSPPLIEAELPETVIRDLAVADEWYVHGHQGETLGPYSVLELELALSRGNLTRTTYVWKKGLPNWIFLYQIPDFDRRPQKIA